MEPSALRIVRRPWALAGLILSVLVVLGLVLFSAQVVGYARDIKAGKPDPFNSRSHAASLERTLAQQPPAGVDVSRVEAKGAVPMLGNPSAKIRIVEFIDYQCPFCQHSAPEVRAFMSAHADEVLLEVRDFPIESLHPQSVDAAIAANCVFAQGNADNYWRYHDILFATQNDLSASALRTNAETVGADLAAYDACVKARTPEAAIHASIEDGVAAGVSGTPTFFVNGARVQGALERTDLEEILQVVRKRL